MKFVSAAFALTALAATTLALAQTPPPTEPPDSEQQQANPTTQPSDASTSSDSGKADTQSLMMKDCIKQVQAQSSPHD